MKQIYDFERGTPPVLSEESLREELNKREKKKQVTLFAIAGFLFQVALLFFGYLAFNAYPIITAICIAYVVISIAVSLAITVIHTQKGGIKL